MVGWKERSFSWQQRKCNLHLMVILSQRSPYFHEIVDQSDLKERNQSILSTLMLLLSKGKLDQVRIAVSLL